MQNWINNAFLFVISLSTSIIAVELISVNIVYKENLLCAEYNSEDRANEPVKRKISTFLGKSKDIGFYCKNL